MITLDDTLAQDYLAECRTHLATIDAGLLALIKSGAAIDEKLVNGVFRAVRSVRGAGFFGLPKVSELAHHMEDVVALIRSRDIIPRPNRVQVLQRAAGKLRELIENPGTSDEADIGEFVTALNRLYADHSPSSGYRHSSAGGQTRLAGSQPRLLLVEDDFASRLLLQTFLSRHGDCHVAVNGKEAVEAFRSALERGQKYDLICMDIMMPEMDGREAVKQMRALEEARGILSTAGAKIIMTTTVDDITEVVRCFNELCDAYLMKPIDLTQLLSQMKSYQLVR